MSKLRKYGIISVLVLAVMMLIPMSALAAVEVGTFKELKDALGKKAPDIILKGNFDSKNEVITIDYNVTLDLNGKTLTITGKIDNKDNRIKVQDGAVLTINDSSGGGKIKGEFGYCIQITDAKVVLNAGTIEAADYGVFISKNGKIDVNGGIIKATHEAGYGISGNGSLNNGEPDYGDTVININGGSVIGGDKIDPGEPKASGAGIYHPQKGTLNISGGEISGYTGIQMKSGTLNMTGGMISSNGAMPNPVPNYNGATAIGAALSIISTSGYYGDMSVNISGTSKLEATGEGSYAIYENIVDETHPPKPLTELKHLNIANGTFIGKAGALNFVEYALGKVLKGGAYSSNPSDYVADGYDAIKNGDKYIVSKKTVEPVLPEGTPETVEPTTAGELTVVEATTDMITSESAAITADDLEIKDGVVVAKETVVKAAAEKAIESAGLNVEVESVVPLPVFACTVSPDKIAAVSFSFQGSELKAATAGAVKVLKILGSDDGKFFTFQSEAANVDDGEFALQSDSGDFMASTDAIDANETYTLILFIKDNGDFDLNDTPGTVVDPAAIVETTAGSHSSSGCNVGFAGLLLMAAVPMIVWRKKQ